MKSMTRWFAFGAVLAAPATLAFATTITPGTTVNAVPIVASTPTAGNTVASIVNAPLVAGTFTGNYTEYVFNDASSPFTSTCGSSCLTFEITVSNNAGSPNGIEHVSTGDGGPPFGSTSVGDGFQYYSLNVGYSGVGVTPATVDESLYGTVEFNFGGSGAIAPGSGSDTLIIQTNASNFISGNLSAIDSSTDTVMGYVPNAVTPEPNSLILLGTGLIGAAGILLARRRNALDLL